MTYTSAQDALSDLVEPAREALEAAIAHFTPEEATHVQRYRTEGEVACSFATDPALSYEVGTRFQVADPSAAAEASRSDLTGEGWEPFEVAASSGPTDYYRRDGFILTVAPSSDRWLIMTVETACFAPDGTRLS